MVQMTLKKPTMAERVKRPESSLSTAFFHTHVGCYPMQHSGDMRKVTVSGELLKASSGQRTSFAFDQSADLGQPEVGAKLARPTRRPNIRRLPQPPRFRALEAYTLRETRDCPPLSASPGPLAKVREVAMHGLVAGEAEGRAWFGRERPDFLS